MSARSQFIALLSGQIGGASSLREIETALCSHRARLYHLNAKPVKRSTLADANAKRSAEVFTRLFERLLRQARRGLRRALGETVYLIDSTSACLNASDFALHSLDGRIKCMAVRFNYHKYCSVICDVSFCCGGSPHSNMSIRLSCHRFELTRRANVNSDTPVLSAA